jgi:hypothetical protein
MVVFWLGAPQELVDFVEHEKVLRLQLREQRKILQKNVLNKVYETHVFMFGDLGLAEKLQFEESMKQDFA